MAITTRDPAPRSTLQKFRATTEGFLLRVSQQEMLRRTPHAGEAQPARRDDTLYKLLSIFFLPAFRLTPWPLKRRLLRAFFVYPKQQWSERPWEEG